jgi:tetratricopeptide (TPR) repeat protein
VTRDGRIFIADYGASAIVVLNRAGTDVLHTIQRPSAALYGATTPYKPQKVAVDAFGNLYVTSEGTHEGILQFDVNGNFSGFFGANKADPLNPMEWIQETLYTEEQKSRLLLRNPPRIVNLHVSEDNLVYSLTQFRRRESIKKLNLAGINILLYKEIQGENNFVDIAVGPGGEMFAVTSTGSITEYDQDGRYLFAFGGRAIAADRNGLTSVVSAISVDNEYNLFVLDKQRGIVQPYVPTDFALSIHEGLAHYAAGQYAQAADIWSDFMRLTPRASFAHWGYGLALWQLGEYADAQYHLELVGDREYASDAFWELRNEWLMNNLGPILVGLGILAALVWALGLLRKKYDFFRPLNHLQRVLGRHSLVHDLGYTKHMIRHPIDAVYDLKHANYGSAFSASLLYAGALGVWLLDNTLAANLFNRNAFAYTWQNPFIVTSMAVIPTVLFVVGNYLISSINDGEGSLVSVYTVMAYALSPYILVTPFITLLSHGLTLNEGFLHGLLKLLIAGYTFVLVFISAKETHNYSVWGTIKNLLLTLCFMVLAVLAIMILYLMWNELIGFVVTMVEEVRYRV